MRIPAFSKGILAYIPCNGNNANDAVPTRHRLRKIYLFAWEDRAMKRHLLAYIVAVAIGLASGSASAKDLFSRDGSLWENIGVVDRQAARQGRGRNVYGEHGLPAYRGVYKGPYLAMAREAARRHSVPVDLFLRLVQQESGWRQDARSHKGAYGLAQLMPATARQLKVDREDPDQNLDGGARYLRQQYDQFGSWDLALAAYNAGPEAVRKHNGIPPYPETRNYVERILGNLVE